MSTISVRDGVDKWTRSPAFCGARYRVHDGAPHDLYLTHKDELNRDLVSFIRSDQE